MCFIRSDKGLGLNTSNASVLKKRHLEDVFLRNVHWPLSSSGMSSEQRFHFPPPPKKGRPLQRRGRGKKKDLETFKLYKGDPAGQCSERRGQACV